MTISLQEQVNPSVVIQSSISSLTLTHFRNYASLSLNVYSAPVILTGENGAGKTNLLEAVSLLTPGRGLRRARLSEMDHQPGSWAIAANVTGPQGESVIGTGRDPQGDAGSDKRLVKIDGKMMRGQSELARRFSALWLTPQMDQLFLESASARRKFLDRLAYGFDPEHAARVSGYEYAMRERGRLLGGWPNADGAWLCVLEQKMAEQAVAMAAMRLQTVERLNHIIRSSPHSFPKAFLRVSGEVEAALEAGQSALEVESALRESWSGARGYDAAAGRATKGAHKSTLEVWHVTKDMPAARCSTGEQKAMLLSIILAQVRAASLWSGAVPVLLLDEVVAHLDARRRRELFEEIEDTRAQAWMTGTDAADFSSASSKSQFFSVKNGKVQAHSREKMPF